MENPVGERCLWFYQQLMVSILKKKTQPMLFENPVLGSNPKSKNLSIF
jgi:hypothetical protein